MLYGSHIPQWFACLIKGGGKTKNVTGLPWEDCDLRSPPHYDTAGEAKGGIICGYEGNKERAVRSSPPTTVAGLRNLAERIQQGDASAETELVDQFSRRIFVMGLVRTHDRETARELVQDVLMAVICALRKGQLQDADKVAAFIHGIARNLINNRLRSESQRPRLEALSEDLAQADLVERLEDAERSRLVQRALQSLAEEDRKILLLTLVEGRKPGEIAAVLGLSSEVVRTRKLRALKKLTYLIEKKMSRS